MLHNEFIKMDMFSLFTKGLDLSIGLISIIIFRYKWRQGTQKDQTLNDLITKIEERDREIERLKILKHAADMRHEHHANECKRTHQHLQTS